MSDISKEITTLLTSQFFSNLINSKSVRIAEFDAILSILIKAQIPFDVQYTPGTGRITEAAQLTIYINPSTTLNFSISFQQGSSLFTGAQP